MKVIKHGVMRRNGKLRMTIELDEDENLRIVRTGHTFQTAAPGEVLVKLKADKYYKLGEPLHEDVFAGHILADATPTHWDTLERKWI